MRQECIALKLASFIVNESYIICGSLSLGYCLMNFYFKKNPDVFLFAILQTVARGTSNDFLSYHV